MIPKLIFQTDKDINVHSEKILRKVIIGEFEYQHFSDRQILEFLTINRNSAYPIIIEKFTK